MGQARLNSTIRQESSEKLKKRTRRAVVAVAAGSLAAALIAKNLTGEHSALKGMHESKSHFDRQYGCRYLGKISLKISELENSGPVYGILEGRSKGVTKGNNITVDNDLSAQEVTNVTKHEMFHACVNPEPVKFARGYDMQGVNEGIKIIASRGFNLQFSDGEFSPVIDEGAVEWIAEGLGDYVPSTNDSYVATRELTRNLSERSGITRQQLQDMYEDSNVLGFMAAVYREDVEDLTDKQVDGFVLMYNGAFEHGMVPPAELIDEVIQPGS